MMEKIRLPYRMMLLDPWMASYAGEIDLRMREYQEKRDQLLSTEERLDTFANGYMFFGFQRAETGWVFREWLPGAEKVFLMGDFNDWNPLTHPLKRLANGVWEIRLEGKDALCHGQYVKLWIHRNDQAFERLPAYSRWVTQDPDTRIFCTRIVDPARNFPWTDEGWKEEKAPIPMIYEAHIGMAQEKEGVGTYREFADVVLPRVCDLGYNTVQLMAIQEHPYYGSFGYQVSGFFAASSWFGEPEDLKYLINTAHRMGIRVLLDVVHSHAAPNAGEGLQLQDGTDRQYFLEGAEGWHPAWGTRLFNYRRPEVLHFLLSNLKFWLEEYHFDGFRFDGVTSMLYHDHGLGTAFTDYSQYFSLNTNPDAVTYLMLANELVHEVNPNAVTVAEDMSGMPGLCLPIGWGGMGFDYRLAMGEPDTWIRLTKDTRDEDWSMAGLWYEMTTRRPGEKRIAYCESHDQALVGDKTLIFRMADAEMYTGMDRAYHSLTMDRAIELHKIIRFLTLTLGGDGYLNFMGNEFGHPEWIDFPREGNGWSHHYARRQWSLAENGYLKYGWLRDFDRAMLALAKETGLLSDPEPVSLWIDQEKKIISFSRAELLFVFNFSGDRAEPSFFLHTHTVESRDREDEDRIAELCADRRQDGSSDVPRAAYSGNVPTPRRAERLAGRKSGGAYQVVLSTDEARFGGLGAVDHQYIYHSEKVPGKGEGFLIYSPARTAMAIRKIRE